MRSRVVRSVKGVAEYCSLEPTLFVFSRKIEGVQRVGFRSVGTLPELDQKLYLLAKLLGSQRGGLRSV